MNTDSITYTTDDVALAQVAIDNLGSKTPVEQETHDGLVILNDWIGAGMTIETIASITDRSPSTVGRLRTIARVGRLVQTDDGTGILNVNSLLNAAKSPVKRLVAPWEKDGRTFATWNAVALAISAADAPVVEEPEEGEGEGEQTSEKSQGERFNDIVAAIQKHARDYDLDPINVALDLVIALEGAADTDAAADEAELAS
jgi:hypothetical protein